MSHFPVAVLTNGTKTVQELLEPYQEHNAPTPINSKYLVFVDTEDGYRSDYENITRLFYFVCDGRDEALLPPFSERFRKPGTIRGIYSSSNYEIPEEARGVQIPVKLLYPTFEDFMAEFAGEVRDPKMGRYGYWENPNAKWDWYELGGRWTRYCVESLGGTCLKVGDIRFDPEHERELAAAEWESKKDDPFFLHIEAHGMSREQFIESAGHLSFRACVTPDGVWHEVGKMGLFGMSDESADELADWDSHFAERFLSDPNLTISVVDCHI